MTFLEDDSCDTRRVAFALHRRLGSAVVRNRLRRRLRAVLAELVRADPGAVPRGAMVISAGPDVSARSPGELRSDVAALFADLERHRARRKVRGR